MTTLAGPATPEDIAAFIATLPTGILVDGHWQDGATGRTFAVQNPADGTILTHVADGDATDAMMAIITAADRAQSARTYPDSRAATSERDPATTLWWSTRQHGADRFDPVLALGRSVPQ